MTKTHARRNPLTRALLTLATSVALAAILAGCSGGGGVATGKLGEALTFSISADRKTERTLTAVDVVPVTAEEAKEWGIDDPDWDSYIVHYTADNEGMLRASDWSLLSSDGKAYTAVIPPIIGKFGCKRDSDCYIIAIPAGTTAEMVRYYGAETGYHKGGGVGRDEWVGWTVEE